MEVIGQMETEEDLLTVTPIRQDSDNDNSLSQTDGVANQIQGTSHETPIHDLTEDVLLPVEHGSTTTQYTGDNVTSQPMAAEILDLPTGPSSPTATPSAYNVESPVSSGESEEPVTSLTPSLSDSPVSYFKNHRIAERIKEIKRRCHEAANAQTSHAERMDELATYQREEDQRRNEQKLRHLKDNLRGEEQAQHFTVLLHLLILNPNHQQATPSALATSISIFSAVTHPATTPSENQQATPLASTTSISIYSALAHLATTPTENHHPDPSALTSRCHILSV
ncbi:mucin-1-like [Palaemon carinicauda]|uniref:mucin-1-like n=1 Tax=Palaemon carinicauda TaxID=392227 RepID=UPI0035B6613B